MSLISGSNSRTVIILGALDLKAAIVVNEIRVGSFFSGARGAFRGEEG